jgi:epoxyqueuosine reductase
MLLAVKKGIAGIGLVELLELTPARFAGVFRRTPVKRLKLEGLLRNACVVAGNVAAGAGPAHELIAPLVRLAAHPAPMVRAHAVWAVHRIAGAAAAGLLAAACEREDHQEVMQEYTEWRGSGD